MCVVVGNDTELIVDVLFLHTPTHTYIYTLVAFIIACSNITYAFHFGKVLKRKRWYYYLSLIHI